MRGWVLFGQEHWLIAEIDEAEVNRYDCYWCTVLYSHLASRLDVVSLNVCVHNVRVRLKKWVVKLLFLPTNEMEKIWLFI